MSDATQVNGGAKETDGIQWVTIDDFTPGVHQVLSQNYPPGTAQEARTFGCFSRDGGVLHPMPRLYKKLYPPMSQLGGSTASEEFRIAGIHAMDPIYGQNTIAPGPNQNNTEVWMAVEYWGSGTIHRKVFRYNWFTLDDEFDDGTWQLIWSKSSTQPFEPDTRPKHCDFVSTRSNSGALGQDPEAGEGDPLPAGPVVLAWCYDGYVKFFPNDQSSTSGGVVTVEGSIDDSANNPLGYVQPINLAGHQGRLVVFPLNVWGWGVHQEQLSHISNEAFYYTLVNNQRKRDPALFSFWQLMGGWEFPVGYEVMESLTANEMLFIKQRGGGFFLTGDLNNATEVFLPNVRSTGMSFNRGTRTPVGFMYPVETGAVWLWAGGDVSENIGKAMFNDFWRPPPKAPAYSPTWTENAWGYASTTCASWDEVAIFPNQWVYDTSFPGFWRLDDRGLNDDTPSDPPPFHNYSVNNEGRFLFASPSGFSDGGDACVYAYNAAEGREYYEWTSQPMYFTINRIADVENVEVVYTTSPGSVTPNITIELATNFEGTDPATGTDSVTIEANPNQSIPDTRRASVKVKGSHLVLRIIARSNENRVPAPTIHSVRLGLRMNEHIQRPIYVDPDATPLPVAHAGPDQTVDPSTLTQLTAGASTDAVSYSWTQVSGPAVALSDGAIVNPTFTTPSTFTESLVFQVQAKNARGFDTDQVAILSADTSGPPTAKAGFDQTIALQDITNGFIKTAGLDGSNSLGVIDTYAWTQTLGTVVPIVDAAAETTSVDLSGIAAVETLRFQIEVTNGSGSDTDTMDIVIY